jgi:hypothetical protein
MSGLITLLELAGPPHGDHAGDGFLGVDPDDPVATLGQRKRVAVEHDQRGCAGRMCRREQRRWHQRAAGTREEDRFTTSEIIEHSGDAVSPLL